MREGLPPHKPTRVMRLATDEARARAMVDCLGEAFEAAETAVVAFATPAGDWRLEAYFARDPNEAAVRELVRGIVGEAADAAVFAPLPPADWVSASLAGLTPVRAGRVLVHGRHDRAAVRGHELAIEIEAGLAFGTGQHATTLGCLLALWDAIKRRRPRRVLDIGTGTGILAIAAAKASRREVIAGDIDAVAVGVARENAVTNGVGALVRFYRASGVRHALAGRSGRFDLVFANILARPLMRLARSIPWVVARHGTLVLSGLVARDVNGVLSAYAAQDFRLLRRADRDGWTTLVLRRGGAAPRPRAATCPRKIASRAIC